MAFEGMTPDQIDVAASQLRAQARELTSVRSRVDGLVREASAHWQGSDVQGFTSSWYGSYSGQVARAVSQLDTMADFLARQANDQRVASQADGSSGAGVAQVGPTGPGNWALDINGAGPGSSDPDLWGTEPFPTDVIQDDPLTPGEIQQHSIGDCWLIAVIMAMMENEEGRQLLRDGVRYDPETQSYQVRLFILGVETWVTVTNPVADAATITGGGYGIVSLYEAAILEFFGHGLLENDTSMLAISVIGDEYPHGYRRVDFGPIDAKISDDAVASGGSADGGISVALTPDDFNGQSTSCVVATPDPSAGHGTIPIQILANHAYEVVDIQNGMIGLRNPHGQGNPLDGAADNVDGVFYISQEDFDRLCSWEFQTEFTGVW